MESRSALTDLQVPATYVQALAELIRSLGADTSDWLAMSGLTMARLEQPDASVSLPLFAQLAFDAVGITREAPWSARAWADLSALWTRAGDERQTLACAERAAALDPTRPV